MTSGPSEAGAAPTATRTCTARRWSSRDDALARESVFEHAFGVAQHPIPAFAAGWFDPELVDQEPEDLLHQHPACREVGVCNARSERFLDRTCALFSELDVIAAPELVVLAPGQVLPAQRGIIEQRWALRVELVAVLDCLQSERARGELLGQERLRHVEEDTAVWRRELDGVVVRR